MNKFNKNENLLKFIGLDAFLNIEDDKIINLKDFFQLTEDEQFYAVNNNQIIEEDKKEDHIWSKY